ncbi:efflux transporter outer membrane subunit [Pollutimonas bauzanensis]|uniref:Outer membrane protein, multidrug efflux system n=1 Tax=Pollutimonas bauzanensis TaxID=658167 RepID=A0A1M5Y7E0_9BURK|nr:efflux transporter outer membrane subunit [Pollutimonas bauzanensis]SHI07849.1 outer membrane protein, multidrug efflux system [Pollutimonas bauzanensis]
MKSQNTQGAALLIAAALILPGCSLAPAHERPPLPVPDAWPAGLAASGVPSPAASADEIAWEDFFQDDRLKQLIRLALDNNRDLRVAALNIDRARALYRVQAADRLPGVSAAVDGSRQRIPGDLAPGGSPVISRSDAVGVGVTSFELDFFGRVRNLNAAALERYLATEEARRSAHIALIAEVARTYEALIADKQLLALSRRTIESRGDSYLRQRDLRRQGASSEYDLRQSESLLEAARATLAQQSRQKSLDENALALLVGANLDQALLPGDDARGGRNALADIPVGLPSDLLAARPDIRQREALLRAENANIGAARAAFFPRIALTGSLGTASSELSGLFDPGSGAWSFMPRLVLPIFDGGRNRAGLGVAKADRGIAIAQYEKAIQEAFREVADALAGRATLSAQRDAVRAQEAAEQVRFDLSRQRYEAGYSSYLEFLDAQRELFAVQQQAIAVGLAELQNRIGLYKALGGGWKK